MRSVILVLGTALAVAVLGHAQPQPQPPVPPAPAPPFSASPSFSSTIPNSPLVQAVKADPVQAEYLARHPEILRWIGKHPDLVGQIAARTAAEDQRAKNKAINEWIAAWPTLAQLLADDTAQTLSWAEEPKALAVLGKKGYR